MVRQCRLAALLVAQSEAMRDPFSLALLEADAELNDRMNTCVGNDIHPGLARRKRRPQPAEKERTPGPGVAASNYYDVDDINPSYDTRHGSHDCQHPMEMEDPAASSSAGPRPNQSKRGKGGAPKTGVRIYGAN
eukprot:3047168-Pyramimonas_sp.AAC.1